MVENTRQRKTGNSYVTHDELKILLKFLATKEDVADVKTEIAKLPTKQDYEKLSNSIQSLKDNEIKALDTKSINLDKKIDNIQNTIINRLLLYFTLIATILTIVNHYWK